MCKQRTYCRGYVQMQVEEKEIEALEDLKEEEKAQALAQAKRRHETAEGEGASPFLKVPRTAADQGKGATGIPMTSHLEGTPFQSAPRRQPLPGESAVQRCLDRLAGTPIQKAPVSQEQRMLPRQPNRGHSGQNRRAVASERPASPADAMRAPPPPPPPPPRPTAPA